MTVRAGPEIYGLVERRGDSRVRGTVWTRRARTVVAFTGFAMLAAVGVGGANAQEAPPPPSFELTEASGGPAAGTPLTFNLPAAEASPTRTLFLTRTDDEPVTISLGAELPRAKVAVSVARADEKGVLT